MEKARRLAELGADHVLLHDSAGALDPGTCGDRRRAPGRGLGRARRPLLPGHRRQGARDGGRGRPARRRADRGRGLSGRRAPEPRVGRGAVRGPDRPRLRARRRRRPGLGRVAVHRCPRHLAHARAAGAAADHPAHRHLPPAGRHRGRDRRAAAGGGRARPPRRGAGRAEPGADRLRHGAAGAADRRHPGRPGGHPRADRPPLGRGVRRDAAAPLRRLRHAAAPVRARGARPRRRAAAAARARHGRPALAGRRRGQRGGPAAPGPVRRGCGPPARGPARARRQRRESRGDRPDAVRPHPRADPAWSRAPRWTS